MGIQSPTFEKGARAYIALIANNILEVESFSVMYDLAYKIYRIIAELQYPEDLVEWYDINEMIDQLEYDDIPLEFSNDDVISKIKNEAKRILEANK